MTRHILLQNATILIPSGEKNDQVLPLRGHSLLISDTKISQIAPRIVPPTGAQLIDCTGKIVSPGFIDSHHHVWQTQLKGRHANHALLEYLPNGNLQHANYTPDDVFWGELAGCLEALDSGTTTIVDHAHMNDSPAHTSNGIEAAIASGIRSVFCYTPTLRVKSWKPDIVTSGNLLDEWVLDELRRLGSMAPFGDGRVQLGLAFDGFRLPKEDICSLYGKAREIGVKLITSHYVRNAFNDKSIVATLDDYGLLDADILLSHASNLTEDDVQKLIEKNAWISTTPETELQMGHGELVCFKHGCSDISSMGVDCHSNNSSDMVSQMRLALQHERARRNTSIKTQGLNPRRLNLHVQDVFRLATIQGARAINMADKLGSIEVGKAADLIIIDGESPGMICATEQDPVAAIVLHSSIRDIETVIVDGIIRKRNGKLNSVNVRPSLPGVQICCRNLEWEGVAKELLSSRARIQQAIIEANAHEPERLTEAYIRLMRLNADKYAKQ
ncbi:hypothetical protein N7533_003616 [Penicillium manginii]|uniref:uncharacterized protein n=1 Tax=Penicillium manginii TaxID=203109 RepID=UPI002549B11F|nr:uncharacterized protein N7533_003616 [Penicillium manginii]KAJ5761577.1 hypothetical protein N7533_003616 [Penicillium manginii]